MKVLVTGCAGLLGYHICKQLSRMNYTVIGWARNQASIDATWPEYAMNLLDTSSVRNLLVKQRPDVVINCVGLPNVDKCEDAPWLAWETNAESVTELARSTRNMGIRLIHISTDHVFDGRQAYRTEEDIPCPVNVYGWSKLGGERSCQFENPDALIIRTSFYGWTPKGRVPTFADWMHTSLRDQKPINLFTDFYFNALEVHHLIDTLEWLLHHPVKGILHVASKDRVSKFEFGRRMAIQFNFDMQNVTKTTIANHPMRVPRPLDLSLSISKLEQLGAPCVEVSEGISRLRKELA